jgi:hypothetical protein
VYIELTTLGFDWQRNYTLLRWKTCRLALARLSERDREEFIRLVAQVAWG